MPKLRLILTCSAAVLALNACKPAPNAALSSDSASVDVAYDDAYDDALPLTTEPADIGVAPAVERLPAAPATQVVYVSQPDDAYEYVDDAYALNDAFADAPPDYGFDYDGVHPWAWRAANAALRLAEATSDGERYYYYAPGARDPYLVRDADYSYAYSGGRLVAVYDARGQALAETQARQRAEWAGRYLARARALEAASRQQHREQVNAQAWAKRQVAVERAQAQWRDQQRKTQAWQQWRARHDRQDRWEDERRRRQQAAADFRTWRTHNYQGPAPVVVATRHDPHGARVAAADARRDQARIDAQKREEAIQKARQQQARIDAAKDRREDAADARHDQQQARADADRRRREQAAAKQRQQAQAQAQASASASSASKLAQQRDAERKREAWRRRHAHDDDKAPAVASDDRRDRDGDGGH